MDLLHYIINFLHYNSPADRNGIKNAVAADKSDATIKRVINQGIEKGYISPVGQGRATRYVITPQAHMLMTFDLDTYFKQDVDERKIQKNFNFDLIENILPKIEIFNKQELSYLEELKIKFQNNISSLPKELYDKEMERLGIDLSWKSSQIEGNTYSLLETERLFNQMQQAEGKTKEEAVMLLNHKDALRFILSEKDYLNPLSVRAIEDIHSILVKGLNVQRNIRNRRVGITGTNYQPLDNEFQIKEALEKTCNLINAKQNVFEKALLILMLISYIQPFNDGNKRTARIVSNSVLISQNCCPLSFRSVDSLDYKKAMLVFYEQNNLYPFKEIFLQQCEFAVETYF